MAISRKLTALCLVAGFLALLGFSFYFLYHSPVVGASFSWNPSERHYRVDSAEPWSALRTGDTILAVDDLPVGFEHLLLDNIYIDSRAEFFSWLKAKQRMFQLLSRPAVVFHVLRDGRKTDLSVVSRKAGLSFFAHLPFLHIVAGIVFFLIGLIVFYKKDSGEESYVFLAMSLLITLIFITNATSLLAETVYQPQYLAVMNVVNMISLPLGNAALFHFCLYLPHKRKILLRFPWMMPCFYFVCIAIIASFQIRVINVLTGTLATMTLLAVLQAFLTHRQPLERQQMKWILAGVLFGLGPWVVLNGIPMLITGSRLVDDTITGACVVFIPLSMAFAIRKYRLMDIDAFLEGTFVYTITILLLLVADLCIFSLVGTKLAAMDPVGKMLLHPILIIVLYIVFRDRIGFILRRVFKRMPLSEADTIALFNKRAAGLGADEVLGALEQVLKESFRLNTLLMIRSGDPRLESLPSDIRKQSGVTNLWEDARLIAMTSQGFYVALAVVAQEKASAGALFLLGAVSGKNLYSRHELAVLNALCIQAHTLHENALLHEKMLAEVNARLAEEQKHLREKEIMLKDLHDGIGGLVANIHLLSETTRRNPSLSSTQDALATVSDLSEKGISEINSFLLSLDPEDATFETLVAELHHAGNTMIASHGLHFRIKKALDAPARQTGRLVFYNVLKIYKEMLNNIIKHARAQSVLVTVSLTCGRFALCVADDGDGMQPAKIKGRGIEHMKARARDMGGRLQVLSDQGTRVCLEVPIEDFSGIRNDAESIMEAKA